MSGYDFLAGVRVLEVAQLGPSSLGGYLADMGADVIKIEGQDGDPVRNSGTPAVGASDGVGLLHLRWNRGKKSVGLDLKTDRGRELFRGLAARCSIVIEGMRAGILDRLGLGYQVLAEENPALVYCSISGLGLSGPYSMLGSHGPSFDAFGGLSDVNPYALSSEERAAQQHVPVGMHAVGLYAAVGVLSALYRAQRTGQGAVIEVAAADSAAHWIPDSVDRHLNATLAHERPGFLNSHRKMVNWSRLNHYRTRDDRGVFFQALKEKFWARFCAAVDRPDLVALYEGADDVGEADEKAFTELTALFRTRTQAEWMDLFVEHDVPGGPVNTPEELATDPHFLARDNVYDVEHPGYGTLRLTSTPVKAHAQAFSPALAPKQFEHTDEVLSDLLRLSAAELDDLRRAHVVLGAAPDDGGSSER